ncbi:MAG: FKBP-type peptidyl-prolyl cis-trans isomerase, partial [Candidatus Altiarchaeota archaeon]|nr:FKBP-type peptidyl-prolyl cis-trans isomerase [Candidatus Altiarchaeota archaeon]
MAKKEATTETPKPEIISTSCDDKPSSCSLSKMSYVIVFLAILVFAAAAYNIMSQKPTVQASQPTPTTLLISSDGPAQAGDIVSLDYIGRFENGTVFDTSIKSVAEENDLYNPVRPYQPLTFTLGAGGLIPGFEKAILGLKTGDEKDFKVDSAQAYGGRLDQLIQKVEKKQRSPIVQNVSMQRFIDEIGEKPYVGLVFQLPENEDFSINMSLKVLEVTDDAVVFIYIPSEGATIDTVFGKADLYAEGDSIVVELKDVKKGQKVLTLDGSAEIVDVDDESITLDFNHPLAGKDLYFWVKLVSLA